MIGIGARVSPSPCEVSLDVSKATSRRVAGTHFLIPVEPPGFTERLPERLVRTVQDRLPKSAIPHISIGTHYAVPGLHHVSPTSGGDVRYLVRAVREFKKFVVSCGRGRRAWLARAAIVVINNAIFQLPGHGSRNSFSHELAPGRPTMRHSGSLCRSPEPALRSFLADGLNWAGTRMSASAG